MLHEANLCGSTCVMKGVPSRWATLYRVVLSVKKKKVKSINNNFSFNIYFFTFSSIFNAIFSRENQTTGWEGSILHQFLCFFPKTKIINSARYRLKSLEFDQLMADSIYLSGDDLVVKIQSYTKFQVAMWKAQHFQKLFVLEIISRELEVLYCVQKSPS